MPRALSRKGEWRSQRIEIITREGRVGRSSWVSSKIPGLAITLSTAPGKRRDRWVVTHIASGRRIAPPGMAPEDYPLAVAKKLALAWAPVLDWTQSEETVRSSTPQAKRAQLIKAFTRITRGWNVSERAAG